MLFNSLAFLGFLAVVIPGYFLLPQRFRALWLMVASYYFYMFAHPEFGWLLFTCTAVSYIGGLAMAQWRSTGPRRLALILGVGVNVGLLVYFKYAGLLARSLNDAFAALHVNARIPLANVVLPVGISFFTFQALSYLFDVYWGRFPAERRIDIFGAFKAFFPQLVAGPIERPGNVIPQLRREHRWDFDRFTNGLRLMLWGFFKKLIIADRLAVVVAQVYGAPTRSSSVQLLVATYAFAWQIFCDFSAYTDIARGCSRILGIELMENFRQPYFSRSIPDFWRRWHISLSTWFRDYLFIPLGGSRVNWLRGQVNVLIIFLVSGLWHGANWKFAVWGALHGVYFIGANVLARAALPRVPLGRWGAAALDLAKMLVTFHLVCLAWIFFRAESMHDAVFIITKIVSHPFAGRLFKGRLDLNGLLIAAGAIVLLEVVHVLQARGGAVAWFDRRPLWVRWPAYYALIVAIFVFAPGGQQEFIYFQF